MTSPKIFSIVCLTTLPNTVQESMDVGSSKTSFGSMTVQPFDLNDELLYSKNF